jgi:(S)-citramalyl-CoA lyase
MNAVGSRPGLDDLVMLLDAERGPQFLLLPKTESPDQVGLVASLWSTVGKSTVIVPIIESALGMASVASIASSPGVAALMFGAADYAADLRASPQSMALQLARCKIAAACATARILAIDAPCFALHDTALLQGELQFAHSVGFGAKAAIHPAHIGAINEAFTPSSERLAWARHVIHVGEQQGTGTVDGFMVDEAIVREARRIVAEAAAAEAGGHREP